MRKEEVDYRIVISHGGKIYMITLKDTKPKKTVVIDNEGRSYERIARKLLRYKAIELGYPEAGKDGRIYSNGTEIITHEYIKRLSRYLNKTF